MTMRMWPATLVVRMLKLERDALIGQALHYQERGDADKAIVYYEKAVAGGLDLAAAWYMLGVLHLQNDSSCCLPSV